MIRAILVSVIAFAYVLLFGTPFLILALVTGNTDPLYNIGIRGHG